MSSCLCKKLEDAIFSVEVESLEDGIMILGFNVACGISRIDRDIR
jgi:hypothetical protein